MLIVIFYHSNVKIDSIFFINSELEI